MANVLPNFESLLPAYLEHASVRKYAHHNFAQWKRIVASMRMLAASPRDFEPRHDFWFMPERRLLIPYFAEVIGQQYAPANALRSLAFGVFRHFETARGQGALGERVQASVQNNTWPEITVRLRAVAAGLPAENADFAALRDVWGAKAMGGETLRESLDAFIGHSLKVGIAVGEKVGFASRIAWFPYLDLAKLADLQDAQRFFFAYYSLFSSTNAYKNGGSQTVAPFLQNTRFRSLIEFAMQWADGKTPAETGFRVMGKADVDDKDCSHYNAIVELFGFINLARGPIYNDAAQESYASYARDDDPGSFAQVMRVGAETRAFLKSRPALVSELAALVTTLGANEDDRNAVEMEGIRLPKIAAQRPADAADQANLRLNQDVTKQFAAFLGATSEFDRAASMFHILLDAVLYEGDTIIGPPKPPPGPPAPGKPPVPPPSSERLRLAPSLRPPAEQALSLLRAGFHVLLAGAPGTGKTTIAQLVGHAWNLGKTQVEVDIPMADAPNTVVAHSAWATFHTVGGLLPTGKGDYQVAPGIFVERVNANIWQLKPQCIVLDEMNRADLDRCIGDLYPILSRSVAQVAPAGLPGVDAIRDHEKFRIVATVNDATLDDIVFPISEGLARRFIRIELLGATLQDLTDYLAVDAAAPERLTCAGAALVELFGAAREAGKLKKIDEREHLPFGVGYFAPLRQWVTGALHINALPDLGAQARRALSLALRSMARVRGFDSVLNGLED